MCPRHTPLQTTLIKLIDLVESDIVLKYKEGTNVYFPIKVNCSLFTYNRYIPMFLHSFKFFPPF